MMNPQSAQEKYHELSYYTLAHPDPAFIHQHIVDAFAAQQATAKTKPITVVFALVGLYLCLEKGYSGRQVQQAHMRRANHNKQWVQLSLPDFRGSITVSEVLAAPAGHRRDVMIRNWCESVWEAWKASHPQIKDLVKANQVEFQEQAPCHLNADEEKR